MIPSFSGPARGSLPRRAISLMLAACSSTLWACRTISSPSGVTVTSLALRSNSLTSSSSSSFLIATDSVGWDTKQASAALPKCFSRATATIYLSSVSVMGLVLGSGLEVLGFSTQPAAGVLAGQLGIAIEHQRREFAGPVQQRGIGRQIGETKQRRARLARAQELAGPANGQVAPRDLEAVGGFDHGLQASPRGLAQTSGVSRRVEKYASRCGGAAAHAATQLMQL